LLLAPTADRLVISAQHYQHMLEHLLACLPVEGCGILGGRPGELVCQAVLPVPNLLRSAVRFRMEPEAQLKAFHELEARDLELLAVFHSHPTGPDYPSPTDLAEFAYPGVLYLIWSPAAYNQTQSWQSQSQRWQCRAFRITGGTYAAVEIEVWPE
jgi:[CysO sulfur-carrier protein]-S-L-cysteine hydrolase